MDKGLNRIIMERIEAIVGNLCTLPLVEFDCPLCAHMTIALKTYYVDWSQLSPQDRIQGVPMPPDDFKKDRRCLVCGKLFQFKFQSEYIQIEEK